MVLYQEKQFNKILFLSKNKPNIFVILFIFFFFFFFFFFHSLFQLASSSMLRLGQETDKEAIKNRDSVYLLLDQVSFSSLFCYSNYLAYSITWSNDNHQGN